MSSATDSLLDKRRGKTEKRSGKPVCTHSGGKLKQDHDTTSSTSKVHEVKPPQAEMHLPNNNIVLSAASVAGIIHVTPFKKKGK